MSGLRRWRWAFLLVLAGCGAITDLTSGPSTSEPVAAPAAPVGQHAVPAVVLGDSLGVQTRDALLRRIPGAVVDAVVGRTMVVPNLSDEALSRVPALVAQDPAWFVVELGTNDATFAGYPDDQLRRDLDAVLAAIGERCIAWVLPYAATPRSQEQIDHTAAFAAMARDAVEQLPCGRALDWPAVAAAEPHVLASDGVHLTALGMERLADLVVFGIS